MPYIKYINKSRRRPFPPSTSQVELPRKNDIFYNFTVLQTYVFDLSAVYQAVSPALERAVTIRNFVYLYFNKLHQRSYYFQTYTTIHIQAHRFFKLTFALKEKNKEINNKNPMTIIFVEVYRYRLYTFYRKHFINKYIHMYCMV